jgi:hypothetical protein
MKWLICMPLIEELTYLYRCYTSVVKITINIRKHVFFLRKKK